VAAVGQVMARARKAGDIPQSTTASKPQPTSEPLVAATSPAQKMIKATPLAKKIAREHQVDLALLEGSGAGGKISDKDVLSYIAAQATDADIAGNGQDYEEVHNSTIRKATAKHMFASLRDSAQLTLSRYVDVTELKDKRKELMPTATWNDWVLRATVSALLEHKDMNAVWVDENIRKVFRNVNLGIAVDTEKGLLVPVIQEADKLSFEALNQKVKAQQEKALNNRLKNEDITNGTFTVTNLGGLGIQFFTPILNPPQVGILGVGRLRSYADVVDGDLKQKWQLPLSITFDHRAIDGAPAARFLQTIEDLLTNPEKLI